ncbi:MAG: glycogen synthase GlgA [Clostridiaceae bacterium]|nr:glycogen synthase GlgA [Bacillota bacterium]NLN52488.1 glycogen synthase GlgA [Clostridiaceae bacterium]
MKILFVSSEMVPLAKSGGLGDVIGALPKAVREEGQDARVVMPLYKQIKDRYGDQLKFMRWSMNKLGWRTMYSGLFSMEIDGVPVYFIDNEYYFGHDSLYLDYAFDIERFSFFQRAVLEALGDPMQFEPDILHLNDWQSGMIPVLLEAHYKAHGYHTNVQCIYTIHNLKFQGIHGKERIQDLMELQDRYMSDDGVMKDGVPNFMKAGILYSNRVTTVSPTYAEEIKQDYYGEGLNDLLSAQSWKVVGVLNGIDVDSYNPETDQTLAKNYSVRTFQTGKKANKLALQEEIGLEQREDVPLLAMITRLTSQKGLDLLLHIADELISQDIQLVILGTGDEFYENAFHDLEWYHPDKVRSMIMFDEELARRIYASADLFLMPSMFEPCGLGQMIAMRYGSLPVVRETGGLKDTVVPYNKFDGSGTGFSFSNINAHEFLFAIKDALEVYHDYPDSWNQLIRQAMSSDFSWERSAKRYIELYEVILSEVQ